MQKEAAIREPLILGHKTFHDVTEDVCKPIEDKAPRMWYILFTIAPLLVCTVWVLSVTYWAQVLGFGD